MNNTFGGAAKTTDDAWPIAKPMNTKTARTAKRHFDRQHSIAGTERIWFVKGKLNIQFAFNVDQISCGSKKQSGSLAMRGIERQADC